MLTCRQATQLLSEKQDRPLFYVSKVVYNCICWHADHAAVMQNRSKQLVSFPKHLKIWITNFS